jgi:hypothetical protein
MEIDFLDNLQSSFLAKGRKLAFTFSKKSIVNMQACTSILKESWSKYTRDTTRLKASSLPLVVEFKTIVHSNNYRKNEI